MKSSVLIVPKGLFPHKRGTQVIDDAALDRMLRALGKLGRDIPVDFRHESFFRKNAEPAGRLTAGSACVAPDGLRGTVEWSPKAEELIRNREYRYLSPVFAYNPAHSANGNLHIERILGLGLTNYPNIPAMEPLFNQIHMEEKMDEFLARLKEALSLPEEADVGALSEAVFAKLGELEPLRKAVTAVGAALGLPEPVSPEDVVTAVEEKLTASADTGSLPTMEEWKALGGELDALKAREVERKIGEAVSSGKLLPAQREWALAYAASDPSGFENFLANSRPVVAMGELVNAGRPASGKTPLDPAQEKINSLLGISRELHEKFNQ